MQITKNLAVLCENTALDKDNKISLFNVFDAINVSVIPGVYPRLYCVVNFEVKDLPANKRELQAQLKIRKPGGDYIGPGIQVVVPVDPVKKVQSIGTIFEVYNLLFSQEGAYSAEVFIEDNLEAKVNFTVKVKV
ncbi:hypothetical protein COT50_02165 [candidate division WWE3 bacterium CG08_land_8_20_14_0_20_41_10]|uniref:Uncharacterized protein n=1 Tax=candidate division WWE3 bacterium CG08_land_8_20_14_0_20_41_10 TaxID=1975085 RepID=A0A2H0XBS8_UNCKA|nr:MAG: hypothetical protein COT50_02165 [candidate division WWE3 bacterium CG08_land_8_20_14_0_20_41_10]